MRLLFERRQERAFQRLYRRHVGDVYRYALVVLRDPEDAETVTQATFANAYRRHARGERPRRKLNWLMRISHDVCSRLEGAPEERLDDDAVPSARDVRRALDRLGYDERAALMMREVECRSFAEIAELLELDDSEIQTLIFRARAALRAQLEGSLTCHQAERAISRRLDGRLPRAERKLLKAHLRTCPDCRSFAETHRRHRTALQSFAYEPLPPRFRSARRRQSAFGLLGRASGVAAIALVTAGIVAGGIDPRGWGRDATRIQPAEASDKTEQQQRPLLQQRVSRPWPGG